MSGVIICSCATVSRSEIQAAIRAGAHTLTTIGEACEAGLGCQSCHADLHALLGDHAQQVLAAGAKRRAQLPLFPSEGSPSPAQSPIRGAHQRPQAKTLDTTIQSEQRPPSREPSED